MTSVRVPILPHLDAERILEIFRRAPGSEVKSGKFFSPESSAALAANTFGLFLDDASHLPFLPGLKKLRWQPDPVELEAVVRLPWSGGLHPCLDALVRTPDALIGIESKRYEPYRVRKARTHSAAYQRDKWGDRMRGYCAVWSTIATKTCKYKVVDVAQLIKHAFAIRTQIHREKDEGRIGVLYYLYAEPDSWPDGRRVDPERKATHLDEIGEFSNEVGSDEVQFAACSYRELLASWEMSEDLPLKSHARAVAEWAGLNAATA